MGKRGGSVESTPRAGYKTAMIIGIVGSDNRAVAIGRLLQNCGHTLTFSDPIQSERALKAAEALGDASAAEAAYQQTVKSDALVMTVRWQDVETALAALGPYTDGVVIDATHAPPLRHGSGAEHIAHLMDNRHVVKAFVEEVTPGAKLSVCANDPNARRMVEELIENCGCTAVERGTLADAAVVEREVLTDGKILPE